MKIFTERGFREELERRREAAEEAMYFQRRLEELEDKIARLYRIVEDRLAPTIREVKENE